MDESDTANRLPPHLDPRAKAARRAPSDNALAPRLDPRGRRAQRPAPVQTAASGGSAFGSLKLGLKLLAAVLSLSVLVGSGWAWASYRNFNSDISRVNAITGGTKASSTNIDGKDQNILVVGNDDRSTATAAELSELGTTTDGGSLNTDTMMLMHVPADGSKATVVSLPRDSYVDIPAPQGSVKAKLNAAYSLGIQEAHGDKSAGAALLVKTIENLTGLSIDHFVQVDLIGFYRISKAIGGVTVCLNSAMGPAKAYGRTGDGLDSGFENGSFVYSYSGINLPKGKSTIEGKQALAFVRQRHGLPNSDLDRIHRQQAFLSAVFNKVSSGRVLLNPFKLQALLKAIKSSLTMDTTMDPLNLAKQMENLQPGNVKFITIPTNGTADVQIDGGSQNVVVVDTAAIPAFIDSVIGNDPAADLKKAKAAAPSSVTVSVINDANANGLENINAAALRTAGFKTVIPAATSDVLAKTTIRYPKGQESAAKALQAAVSGAVMERSSTVSRVTLLLGNNGVQVRSLMPAKSSAAASTPASTPTSAGPGSAANPSAMTAASSGCVN